MSSVAERRRYLPRTALVGKVQKEKTRDNGHGADSSGHTSCIRSDKRTFHPPLYMKTDLPMKSTAPYLSPILATLITR
ncbi:hypothetical protein ACJ72_04215 [Emergomyces africanus]|uniref:Uncharacterized protein n=1 Tax=Emergomyces africanus TaxID=1955775 RepID=A0A1B7NXE1_9EURO|nr:hypothetical protein ACJ72_04215 [Emergomyces africanus]